MRKTILLILAIFIFLLPWIYLHSQYDRHVVRSFDQMKETSFPEVAIVLGAGLDEKNEASKILRDRLETAKKLYDAGKIKHLLLTGKNIPGYSETAAMKKWAFENGIPANVLWIDEQGSRTFNSCQNAKSIYQLNEAVVITQNFHLYRARYLCEQAGIHTQGMIADIGPYSLKNKIKWNVREMFAAWRALWDN